MYVVAITRWGKPLQEEVVALAALLGMVAYDARLRLAGPLPVVFAREPDGRRARELASALTARGHGVVACDLATVKASSELLAPKSYAFESAAFAVHNSAWGTVRLRYEDIVALLPASAVLVEDTDEMSKEKKFSLGRAVVTGGLVMRKTRSQQRSSSAETREPVLYVISKNGESSLLLRSHYLHHQGLGPNVQPTSLQNFATLIQLLRERAPGALYDDRLKSQRRRAAVTGVARGSARTTTSSSNASANDLAVHLLVMAHGLGRL